MAPKQIECPNFVRIRTMFGHSISETYFAFGYFSLN
jgi:hypothetical protein